MNIFIVNVQAKQQKHSLNKYTSIHIYFISLYKFPDKYEHIPDSSFDCIFKFYK